MATKRQGDKATRVHESMGRLVKKDFYIGADQDVRIDKICTEMKIRAGRAIARSDVVRDALNVYFRMLEEETPIP